MTLFPPTTQAAKNDLSPTRSDSVSGLSIKRVRTATILVQPQRNWVGRVWCRKGLKGPHSQFELSRRLNCNLLMQGVGGLDTGTLEPNCTYLVYLVATRAGKVALMASTDSTPPLIQDSFVWISYPLFPLWSNAEGDDIEVLTAEERGRRGSHLKR